MHPDTDILQGQVVVQRDEPSRVIITGLWELHGMSGKAQHAASVICASCHRQNPDSHICYWLPLCQVVVV